MKGYILGISCYYHDSAAALVREGEVIGAVQEERFSRIKNDSEFPAQALRFLLSSEGISLKDVDSVVYYEKPFVTFERLIASYVHTAPFGIKSFLKAIPLWIKKKLFLKHQIANELRSLEPTFSDDKILFSEHHLSHAAGSYFTSGFTDAVILVMDGVGEWASTSIALGSSRKIKIEKEIHFPNSLGLLYSAFTGYLGFEVNEGEYKLMGLAPYGSPRFAELIKRQIVDIKDDGSFRLNLEYFDFVSGLEMTNSKFHKLFGATPRPPQRPLTTFEADIAASIQIVTEEILLKIIKWLSTEYSTENLCLSGGVALNCVANGKIKDCGYFKNVWVQPASGDAGGAVGAALIGYHQKYWPDPRRQDEKFSPSPYLGPCFSLSSVQSELENLSAVFHLMSDEDILGTTAKLLSDGCIVGWFQDKLEFGPRALGNRSILADPRRKNMQRDVNLRIKYREGFRPFAPAILLEYCSDWFVDAFESPYMLFVRNLSERKSSPKSKSLASDLDLMVQLNRVSCDIPAVTHVDYSSRVQTVRKEFNPKFHALITEFFELTGCPVLLNTSMNVRGEPMVCSPRDAFRCFMTSQLDCLVIGNCILFKEEQFENLELMSKKS